MSTIEEARGFKPDALTEADDRTVESIRDRLYAAPCGHGTWVSVKDGVIITGNGGNEREQWHWSKRGPWIRLDDDAIAQLREPYLRSSRRATERLDALRSALSDALEASES